MVTHEAEYVDLAFWITHDEEDWETSPDAMHYSPEDDE